MLYNISEDTIMEPIGWLFEVLSGLLYWPFQINEDTIIVGLIVITPIAAGALCLIIDWALMSGMSSVISTAWKIILHHFGSTSSATAAPGRVG